jgi:hypothetical protein
VDVIDTTTMTRIKSIPVKGRHPQRVRHTGWQVRRGGIDSRPHAGRDRRGDRCHRLGAADVRRRPSRDVRNGTGRIHLENVRAAVDYHGVAVVDFAARKEVSRFLLPDIPGETKETEGLQGAPAHGLGVTPDGKRLFATSKYFGQLYAYSLPDLRPIGSVHVGHHPEWLTFSPDGKLVYVAVAGDNAVSVVDTTTLRKSRGFPSGRCRSAMGRSCSGGEMAMRRILAPPVLATPEQTLRARILHLVVAVTVLVASASCR